MVAGGVKAETLRENSTGLVAGDSLMVPVTYLISRKKTDLLKAVD